MTDVDNIEFPSPSEFLNHSRQLQDESEKRALVEIPNMGEKLPGCYSLVGRTLYFLDAMGSCLGVCEPKNHDITYLSARTSSFGRASLRLAQMSHYHESLLLTRSVGEVANLLTLLAVDSRALMDWRKDADKFSPVKVRIRLEKAIPAKRPIGVDQETYGILSSQTAHVNRQHLNLNAFNDLEIPTAGNQFQDAGLMISINELAYPLALACISIAKLLGCDIGLHQSGRKTAFELLRNVGAVNLVNYQKRRSEFDDGIVSRSVRERLISGYQRTTREIQARWRSGNTEPQIRNHDSDQAN